MRFFDSRARYSAYVSQILDTHTPPCGTRQMLRSDAYFGLFLGRLERAEEFQSEQIKTAKSVFAGADFFIDEIRLVALTQLGIEILILIWSNVCEQFDAIRSSWILILGVPIHL